MPAPFLLSRGRGRARAHTAAALQSLALMPLLLLLLLLPATVSAQPSQAPAAPEDPAASEGLFEPGLISDGGVFCLTLSPEGSQALWVRSGGARSALQIMESTRAEGRWQTPRAASFSGDPRWKDIDPMFSPDGRRLIFQSNRPVPGQPARSGFDIWSVHRLAEGWSAPVHLGDGINGEDSESSASLAADGSLYFMKNDPEGRGQSDLFVSRLKDGRYQPAQSLGPGINTTARESNPFIAPDQSYLIYFSSGPGVQGETDLLISFQEAGRWSAPVNLGAPINSRGAEFCPMVHQGRLYLSRQFKAGERLHENIHAFPFDPERYRR